MESEEKAREWQRIIMEVVSGRLNVTEAAEQMGVSRKTYYEKQERAFSAMLEALKDRPTGRPGQPADPEKAELLEDLESSRKAQEVLVQKLRIQNVLRETLMKVGENLPGTKKKRAT